MKRPLVRLLAVNDVYKLDFLPQLATLLNDGQGGAERLGADSVTIRVVAGDFLSPNVLSSIDKGRSFLKTFNRLGFTHACFGNHEADLKKKELQLRCGDFQGVWINSNVPSFLSLAGDGAIRNEVALPTYDVVSTPSGALKVGILGLISDEPNIFANNTFKGHVIGDVVEATREVGGFLRDELGCHAVVALTHQSIARDKELARECHDVLDAIVGGHEHVPYDVVEGNVRIVKAGADATFLSVLDIWGNEGEVDRGEAQSKPELTYTLLDVDEAEPNEAIQTLVSEMHAVVEALHGATLLSSSSSEELTGEGTRFRQTSLGAFLADAVRDELGAECATINGASIKAGSMHFPKGEISYQQLQECLPFPTKMVVVDMEGEVLQEAVRFSRANGAYDAEKRGFLQLDSGCVVENATVTGDYGDRAGAEAMSEEQRSSMDTIATIADQPFDPARLYRVAIPRNLFKGFCEIEPLVTFGKDHSERLPSDDSFRNAIEIVKMNASRRLWDKLGSFESLDADGDGTISRSELRAALEALREHDRKLKLKGGGGQRQGSIEDAGLPPLQSPSSPSLFQRHKERKARRGKIPIARGASGIDLLIDDLQRVADEDGDAKISREEFQKLKKEED